eukprot:SAG31_NODE_2534_length_5554_cov_3.741155_3_plen_79_part_00
MLKANAPQLFDPSRAPKKVITEFGRALTAKSACLVSAVEYTMHRHSKKQLAIIHAGSGALFCCLAMTSCSAQFAFVRG